MRYRLEIVLNPGPEGPHPVRFWYVNAACKEMARVLFFVKVWRRWVIETEHKVPLTRFGIGKVEEA